MKADRTARIVAAVLLLLSTAVWAQLAEIKKTTPEERAALLTMLMKARLGLAGDQLHKVAAINLEYAKKMEPILQSSDRPFREIWEMKRVNGEKEAALKDVLTSEQFQKYLATRDELRHDFEQRIMNRRH